MSYASAFVVAAERFFLRRPYLDEFSEAPAGAYVLVRRFGSHRTSIAFGTDSDVIEAMRSSRAFTRAAFNLLYVADTVTAAEVMALTQAHAARRLH